MNKVALALVILPCIALAACSKKTPPQDLPTPPAETARATPPRPAAQPPMSTAPVPGSQADFLASVSSDHVLFDTDMFDIDAEDQQILQSQARWLARYPQKAIVLEGHCDERGTREYNLALGERRANAAKNYLATLGVDLGRMAVISYGKERPVAIGSDEQAWSQNRRAVTVTVE